jgi:hypothetical protein
MPYNLFKKFKISCRDKPNDVLVEVQAEKDARRIYKLNTKKELLEFIGNDGIEDLKFFNKTDWRNNPDREKNPLDVYSYTCKTLFIPCYIAIIFIPSLFGKTINKWKLKSFHMPEDSQPTLANQLKALGLSHSEENND